MTSDDNMMAPRWMLDVECRVRPLEDEMFCLVSLRVVGEPEMGGTGPEEDQTKKGFGRKMSNS